MTFVEYMIGYANDFAAKGEKWSQRLVLEHLHAGVNSVDAVIVLMQSMTADMATLKSEGHWSDYAHVWSKRDRFEYMLYDWKRYQDTGKNYFWIIFAKCSVFEKDSAKYMYINCFTTGI